MDIFFLSCLKASELIEKKMHIKLSVTEHLQLKVHKMMCDACTAFEKQSVLLEKGIEKQLRNQKEEINIDQFKKQIHTRLGNSSK